LPEFVNINDLPSPIKRQFNFFKKILFGWIIKKINIILEQIIFMMTICLILIKNKYYFETIIFIYDAIYVWF
jgi:hypothetical protein